MLAKRRGKKGKVNVCVHVGVFLSLPNTKIEILETN